MCTRVHVIVGESSAMSDMWAKNGKIVVTIKAILRHAQVSLSVDITLQRTPHTSERGAAAGEGSTHVSSSESFFT